MKRREAILATAGLAASMISGLARAAKPCPPPQVDLAGGTSATTTCGAVTSGNSYSTQFAATESPISEGGIWTNGGTNGLDWHDVRTTPGEAFAVDATSGYADAIAHLNTNAWPASLTNYKITGVIRRGSIPSSETGSHEVELHLRQKITAHNARGYECFINAAGQVSIARWNGAASDFTFIGTTDVSQVTVNNGSVFEAQIIGSSGIISLDGVQIAHFTDSSFADGFPGMGFDKSAGLNASLFGFSSWSVVAL